MKNYPKHIRNNLLSVIKTMGETPWLYAKDPTRDFSRRRKIPFEKLLTTLIGMGGGNLTKEILDSLKKSKSYIICVGESKHPLDT